MSGSNLQKAKRLLEKEDAHLQDLEAILAVLNERITNHNRDFDKLTKTNYAQTMALLTNRISSIKTAEKAEKQKRSEYMASRKREMSSDSSSKNSGIDVNALNIPKYKNLNFKTPLNYINYYLQKELSFESTVIGGCFWVPYDRMKAMSNYNMSRSFLLDNIIVNLTANVPSLWIGDLKLVDKKISGKYLESIDALPVINLERVKAIYDSSSIKEFIPEKTGQLFWTRTPQKANFGQGLDHNTGSHKKAEYIIKLRGIVTFLYGITESDINSRDIYDFVYDGLSAKGNTASARFITDSIRGKVRDNIEKYIELGKR